MAKREDTSVRDSLTRLLPPVRIRRLAVETGALKRRRKVDVAAFVYSIVLGFAAGGERTIAGLRRSFERATGERLAPSAFYGRFTAPLVRLLERLVAEGLTRLAAKTRPMRDGSRALPGRRAAVTGPSAATCPRRRPSGRR